MTILSASKLSPQSYTMIKRGDNNLVLTLLITIVYAIFLGMRPLSSRYFCDTVNYAQSYYFYQVGINTYTGEGDWVFDKLMAVCSPIMDVSYFFTIIAIGYFFFTLWACMRFCSNNVFIVMLFMMGALSFFTYGTNGIRNGLACSGVLLFLSFLGGTKKDKIIAALIAILIIGTHKSTSLPILMAVISLIFVKNFRNAYIFWILSILISLVAGNSVASTFASLGFDDRLSTYINTSAREDMFSHTGFRFDFLIYSMMPIVLGYYIIIKRGIRNRTYEFLLNTYTLSNAFWIMVIRANFSNRFAYLSWFMYALVLAYPLLKLNIWGDVQGKRVSQIMLAHIGFTWFMSTFYW